MGRRAIYLYIFCSLNAGIIIQSADVTTVWKVPIEFCAKQVLPPILNSFEKSLFGEECRCFLFNNIKSAAKRCLNSFTCLFESIICLTAIYRICTVMLHISTMFQIVAKCAGDLENRHGLPKFTRHTTSRTNCKHQTPKTKTNVFFS